MFESACVVGAGRVGKAVAARLGERIPTRTTGREVDCAGADVVLVCVPDRAIAGVASAIPPGPWVAHTSGACRLSALDPHTRRFSLHPLQTFTNDRGAEQLDGAWAALSGESPDAIAAAESLAGLLDVKGFVLDDEARPLYHAAASFASAFLVTLRDVAADLMREVGAPPEALEPLMLRTIENGFQHTGPLVRGDWETVERHVESIASRRPDLTALHQALVSAEAELLETGVR
jgi:predicted short-subunit dehydrogenase-like oxidoreductase (DUF2520 family)